MTDNIPRKLCECGCGQETTVYRGTPRRFITGHNMSSDVGREEQSKRKSAYFSVPEHLENGRVDMARARYIRWCDPDEHIKARDLMLSNNPMSDPDTFDKHAEIMKSQSYRDTLSLGINRYFLDPSAHERRSAELQDQDYDAGEWTGFTDKQRSHLIPPSRCIQMNDWFVGCNIHHITKSIVAHIPKELHRHIPHNIKTGENMGEMNALAIQFINGGL